MKAAIYNPYFDTLGGGERYSLAFATSLQKMGYDVYIQWENKAILKSLEDRFGIDLSKVNLSSNIKKGDGFDVCFWVSDGSIPLLRARKNVLHFQIPFQNVDGRSLMNKMKMFRINKVVCNSKFTKEVVDQEYGINSTVLYPPVDTTNINQLKKKNSILFVGRFSQLTQSKNQHVLVNAFKKLVNKGLKKYELILAGGTEVGAKEYVKDLKKLSEGLSVRIIESPSYEIIKKLYGTSKFFWSASGYGSDELIEPKKVEHFGISVVEAMSAGCVPIVFAAGGHKEIIKNGLNGFLWKKLDELIKLTQKLTADKALLEMLTIRAIEDSKRYSYEQFDKTVQEIVG